MHNLELLLIRSYIERFRPAQLFESGVLHGRSSAVLAQAMAQFAPPNSSHVTACFPQVPRHLADVTQRVYSGFAPRSGGGQVVVTQLDANINSIAVVDGPKPALKASECPLPIDLEGRMHARARAALSPHMRACAASSTSGSVATGDTHTCASAGGGGGVEPADALAACFPQRVRHLLA